MWHLHHTIPCGLTLLKLIVRLNADFCIRTSLIISSFIKWRIFMYYKMKTFRLWFSQTSSYQLSLITSKKLSFISNYKLKILFLGLFLCKYPWCVDDDFSSLFNHFLWIKLCLYTRNIIIYSLMNSFSIEFLRFLVCFFLLPFSFININIISYKSHNINFMKFLLACIS